MDGAFKRGEGDLVYLSQGVLDAGLLMLQAKKEVPQAVSSLLDQVVKASGFERGAVLGFGASDGHARIVAATDDVVMRKSVALAEYPELVQAAETKKPVCISDVTQAKLMNSRKELSQVGALAVFPVLHGGDFRGAIFLRDSQRNKSISEQTHSDCGFAARALAPYLASLTGREQTQQISRLSYQMKRTNKIVGPLRDHFESSSEGVFVVDISGIIVFVNRAAGNITGFAADAIVGKPLCDFLPDVQKGGVEAILADVIEGNTLEAFDLCLLTTAENLRCVSVTTSTVLSHGDAAVLSFRDVTEQRSVEAELRQTKDFLENLIDSAVDAIVAADLNGKIIVFNSGAEGLFGYDRESAHGTAVKELFPEGDGAKMYEMLRSGEFGGEGRLVEAQVEIKDKSDGRIPVNISASIITEEGEEVAIVAVISDLRDRMLIESRLRQTQKELEEKHKLAVVAQLAGTAAHELNQPLTSILAYGDLIRRKHQPDGHLRKALDVISSEAERMAAIVKQIGKITSFETKPYLGSTSIVDLEKSVGGGSNGA